MSFSLPASILVAVTTRLKAQIPGCHQVTHHFSNCKVLFVLLDAVIDCMVNVK